MGEVKNLGLILIKLENIENLLIQNGSKKVYRIAIIFTYFRWIKFMSPHRVIGVRKFSLMRGTLKA